MLTSGGGGKGEEQVNGGGRREEEEGRGGRLNVGPEKGEGQWRDLGRANVSGCLACQAGCVRWPTLAHGQVTIRCTGGQLWATAASDF